MHFFLVMYILLYLNTSHSLLQLSCSLEYWSEAGSCWEELTSFHISESAHAEWEVPPSLSLVSVASRRWRISVNHIEWIDEDMEEILV